MKVTALGIDLAKNVFHLCGMDKRGKVVLRKRVSRNKLLEFLADLPVCLIGMEACGSAHHWGREMKKLGHEVRLMSPQYVKPYVKTNKNDDNDAEGVCEAVGRPTMRFVPLKSVEQQDIQVIHRIRQQLVKSRTALVNQMRGVLGEYGIVIPQGIEQARKAVPRIVEDAENGLSDLFRELLAGLYDRLVTLDEQVASFDKKSRTLCQQSEACQRVAQVGGVGPLIATAFVSSIGDAQCFRHGRQASAWVGLVPRQCSTGGKALLLGISKRGDRYLRTLLIQGARTVVRAAQCKQDSLSRWINALRARRGFNVAAVAVANKNVRVMWALLTRGQDYRRPLTAED